jgi:hypothetical protein
MLDACVGSGLGGRTERTEILRSQRFPRLFLRSSPISIFSGKEKQQKEIDTHGTEYRTQDTEHRSNGKGAEQMLCTLNFAPDFI